MQKVFWTPRTRALLHWCEMGLHRCKRGFGWCKRLLGDLCSLGPKESKRKFCTLPQPLLETFPFWAISPGPQHPKFRGLFVQIQGRKSAKNSAKFSPHFSPISAQNAPVMGWWEMRGFELSAGGVARNWSGVIDHV